MTHDPAPKLPRLIEWIVDNVRQGALNEVFDLVWVAPEGDLNDPWTAIVPALPTHPTMTAAAVERLVLDGLLWCNTGEGRSTCTVTACAYDVVDAGRASARSSRPSGRTHTAALAQSSSDTHASIAPSPDREPALAALAGLDRARERLGPLTQRLLDAVRGSLSPEELRAYSAAAHRLEGLLASAAPATADFTEPLRTVALLGEVTGSLALTARVWPLVQPLLDIAARIAERSQHPST